MDVDALSREVTQRFVEMPWNRFNSQNLSERSSMRSEVLQAREDLLKVAAVDAGRAGRIWDEHVPSYVPRPSELPEAQADFMPTNGIEVGRRRKRPRPEAYLDASAAEPLAAKPKPADERGANASARALPDAGVEAEPAQAETTSRETLRSAQAKPAIDEVDRRDKRTRLLLEGLEKQYLRTDDKYHFRDRGREVAFEAREKKLLTSFETPAVVGSMIDLAETRGWTSLKVSGTNEFRREAWLQASLRDFEVSGYRPSKLDQARLDELRTERGGGQPGNVIANQEGGERNGGPSKGFSHIVVSEGSEPRVELTGAQDTYVRVLEATMRHRGDPPQAISKARELATDRLTSNRVHVGELVEVGTAPYQDREGEARSHFVTLRDDHGTLSKIWGVDLPRALEVSKARTGDHVAIAFKGRNRVTVDVPVKDGAGNTVRTDQKTVDRNTWEVVPFDRLRADAKAAVLKAVERQVDPGKIKVFDRSAKSAIPPLELKTERSRSKERTL